MLRYAFRASLFAALLLVGLAGWAASRGNPLGGAKFTQLGADKPTLPAGGLCIECPEQDLGELPVGTQFVDFVVSNPSAVEGRLLGGCGTCGWTCCVKPVDEGPVVTIAPGKTYTMRCTVLIFKDGPFEGSLTVFVDRGGPHPIPLPVRGVGIRSFAYGESAGGVRQVCGTWGAAVT